MSELLSAQAKFAQMAASLIIKAGELGYQVTLGEAYRSAEEARRLAGIGKGVVNSLHCKRLALDVNLFKSGVLLTKTEDYAQLGAWFESIGGAWGGRFSRADGNHFSLPFEGVK